MYLRLSSTGGRVRSSAGTSGSVFDMARMVGAGETLVLMVVLAACLTKLWDRSLAEGYFTASTLVIILS